MSGITIDVNVIPDDLFISGVKVLTIAQAKIVSRAEKKVAGLKANDVQIKEAGGRSGYITRTFLRENYLGVDNKKLSISGWKTGKAYFVIQKKNAKVGILHIPTRSNKEFISKGGVLAPGSYYVCLRNSDGTLNKESGTQISPKLFKKMYLCLEGKADITEKFNNSINHKIEVGKANNVAEVAQSNRPVVLRPSDNNSNELKINQNASLTVVAKVVRGTITVGYMVSNGKTERPFNKAQMMELCRAKKIRNMGIVTKDDKEYLRGIGITQESLPSKYI